MEHQKFHYKTMEDIHTEEKKLGISLPFPKITKNCMSLCLYMARFLQIAWPLHLWREMIRMSEDFRPKVQVNAIFLMPEEEPG